jgi:hypothetical protein
LLGFRFRVPLDESLEEFRKSSVLIGAPLAQFAGYLLGNVEQFALYSIEADNSDGIVVLASKQIFGDTLDSVFKDCQLRRYRWRYCFRGFVAHRNAAMRRSNEIHPLIKEIVCDCRRHFGAGRCNAHCYIRFPELLALDNKHGIFLSLERRSMARAAHLFSSVLDKTPELADVQVTNR